MNPQVILNYQTLINLLRLSLCSVLLCLNTTACSPKQPKSDLLYRGATKEQIAAQAKVKQSTSQAKTRQQEFQAKTRQQLANKPYQINGKLLLTYKGQQQLLNFTWRQKNPNEYQLRLISPLLSKTMILTEYPHYSSIQTAERQFTSTRPLQNLVYQQLGWPVPTNQLSNWLVGEATKLANWQLQYDNYQPTNIWPYAQTELLLPQKITLTNKSQQVMIKIKIQQFITHTSQEK